MGTYYLRAGELSPLPAHGTVPPDHGGSSLNVAFVPGGAGHKTHMDGNLREAFACYLSSSRTYYR